MNFESQDRIIQKWDSIYCPFCNASFRVERKDLLPIDHYSFSCLSCKRIFWAGVNEKDKVDVWTFKPYPAEENHGRSRDETKNTEQQWSRERERSADPSPSFVTLRQPKKLPMWVHSLLFCILVVLFSLLLMG